MQRTRVSTVGKLAIARSHRTGVRWVDWPNWSWRDGSSVGVSAKSPGCGAFRVGGSVLPRWSAPFLGGADCACTPCAQTRCPPWSRSGVPRPPSSSLTEASTTGARRVGLATSPITGLVTVALASRVPGGSRA
eukprot:5144395-Pleurochrysis_carterae.AAC.1